MSGTTMLVLGILGFCTGVSVVDFWVCRPWHSQVLGVGGFLVMIASITLVVGGFSAKNCDARYEDVAHSEWGWWSACRVEVDGVLVPEERIVVVDGRVETSTGTEPGGDYEEER